MKDNIMIADVFKFIEHVHKIEVFPVARALFALYFPRKQAATTKLDSSRRCNAIFIYF